jgi:divalent metal cation (Fe/Co/Zn/Cd) transporter
VLPVRAPARPPSYRVHPQPVTNIAVLIAAGLIGFAGNELVAIYRIGVGRRIGSARLPAQR